MLNRRSSIENEPSPERSLKMYRPSFARLNRNTTPSIPVGCEVAVTHPELRQQEVGGISDRLVHRMFALSPMQVSFSAAGWKTCLFVMLLLAISAPSNAQDEKREAAEREARKRMEEVKQRVAEEKERRIRLIPVIDAARAVLRIDDEKAEKVEAETKDEEPSKDGDKPLEPGPIVDVAENIEQLINLDWNEGKLDIDFKEDRNEISQIVSSMRRSIGGGGMSSSSSGNGAFMYSFSGQRLNGIVQNNWPYNSNSGLKLQFTELESPKREMTIESKDNDISMRIIGGKEPYILQIRQEASGRFSVQDVNVTDVFSEDAVSFGEFCRQNVEYSQKRLLPLLRQAGLKLPPTPQDAEVQAAVIERFTPIDPERLSKFREMIAGFDSTQFEERQEVSEAVSESYPQYSDIISRVINDDSFSAEARSRLLELYKKHEKPEDVRIRDVIDRLQLTSDADFLAWMLTQTEDPNQRTAIVSELEVVTEQSFGDDVAAWQSFAAENRQEASDQAVEADIPTLDIFDKEGVLTKMSEETQRLVRLHRTPNGIGIDRQVWSEQFYGKSLAQLSEEIKGEIRERGLPESFFNAPTNNPKIGYPHILFESFYQKLRTIPHSGSTYYRSNGSTHQPNRTFASNGLDCSLATSETNQNAFRGGIAVAKVEDAEAQKNNDKDMDFPDFQISLVETDAEQRRLLIDETKEGGFRAEINANNAGVMMRLIRLPEDKGWLVQDIRGTKVFTDHADSFDALYGKHQQYFDQDFFPTLENLGVKTDLVTPAPVEPKEDKVGEETPANSDEAAADNSSK